MMRLSTPRRDRPRSLYSLGLLAFAVFGLSLGSPPATAAECSDSSDDGVCLDAGTFQWCEDGELKSAKCPEGQICVADNPFYDGAGCVATDETACGEISPEGECTTANGVVWCDEGVPMVFPCGEDSVCGWDEDNGEYDCLPRSNLAREADAQSSNDFEDGSEPEAGGEDTATDESDPGPEPDAQLPDTPEPEPEATEMPEGVDSDDKAAGTMSPSVTPTDTSAMDESPATEDPSDGCQGVRSSHNGLLLLWTIALLMVMRRRDGSVTTA